MRFLPQMNERVLSIHADLASVDIVWANLLNPVNSVDVMRASRFSFVTSVSDA
jgi:hypothetical protein